MRSIQLFSSLFFLFLLATTAQTQESLKSPSEFLPYDLGDKFTPHHLLVDYFQHVAEQTDHIIYKEYGKTNEDRPLIYTIISSKENLAKLENIRTDNLKRVGLLPGKPSGEKEIAVVWLSHGVHGNEASASEAAMGTLYELAHSNNTRAQEWLKSAVVILDPSINPDGYSRYTHWNRSVSNKLLNIKADSREHAEPWPGGRTNHYYFDLNRDWAWLTQIESQQRLEIYHQWMPHVHVDFHEMGVNSPYYFAPATPPYHQYLSEWQLAFQTSVAKNHARYFDKNGWFYYTKETFDLFYPGYGDTYPMFNGAVGMTYEQGGGSRAGRGVLMNNEDTLTLHDRIAHHMVTGLSTIEASAKNAKSLTENFENYFKNASSSPQGKHKAYVIKGSNAKSKLKYFTGFLDKHKIAYGKNTSGKSVEAYNYATGRNEKISIQKNDLIISAYQPMSVIAQVLLEPDHFLEDSLTYDITAWSIPHAFGLEAYALKEKIKVEAGYDFPQFSTGVKATDSPYAFLVEWTSLNSSKFISALIKKGVKVRYASAPFDLEGKNYKTGTLMITKADNKKLKNKLAQIMMDISIQYEHDVYKVTSGLASKGPDLGSGKMRLIKEPRVVALAGNRVWSSTFGQLWHYFENDLDYPISIWSPERLKTGDLDAYNTLILPEGFYRIDDSVLKKISTWANAGGKVIAIGSAVSKFEDKSGFTLTPFASESEKGKDKSKRTQEKLDSRLDTYDKRERRSIPNQIPGAIYKLRLDNSHPLAFGMPDYYFSLKTSSRRYSFLKDTWNVGYIGKNPLIHGFAGSKAKEKMKDTTVFAVQRKGRGSIVYLVDNPLYRGFWRQGKFLFSNALFF